MTPHRDALRSRGHEDRRTDARTGPGYEFLSSIFEHALSAIVTADDTGAITGWVRHRDLLNALSRQPADLSARQVRPGPAVNPLNTARAPRRRRRTPS